MVHLIAMHSDELPKEKPAADLLQVMGSQQQNIQVTKKNKNKTKIGLYLQDWDRYCIGLFIGSFIIILCLKNWMEVKLVHLLSQTSC